MTYAVEVSLPGPRVATLGIAEDEDGAVRIIRAHRIERRPTPEVRAYVIRVWDESLKLVCTLNAADVIPIG